MTDNYDPVIPFQMHVTQADSRIFQKRAGDVNCGIHDEQIRRLFNLQLPTLLPGQILNTIVAHRDVYYVEKYLSETDNGPKELNIEEVTINLKDTIEIENGKTAELLLRSFPDYTKYPIISVDNKIVVASQYEQAANGPGQEPVDEKAIDKMLRYQSKVRLSSELNKVKFDPSDDANGPVLNWGQLEVDWKADDEYYSMLERLCGCSVDRQVHVPLYLAANFARIFLDLLIHPERVGPYRKEFHDLAEKNSVKAVDVEELASLIEDQSEREEFRRLAPLYQLDDKLWFATRRLPAYDGEQKIRIFDGIKDIYSGQACDIFLRATFERRNCHFTLIGTVHKESGYWWKVFESDMQLRFRPLRNMGFEKLFEKVEAKRKATQEEETEETTT